MLVYCDTVNELGLRNSYEMTYDCEHFTSLANIFNLTLEVKKEHSYAKFICEWFRDNL
jgi:hypothetical protein